MKNRFQKNLAYSFAIHILLGAGLMIFKDRPVIKQENVSIELVEAPQVEEISPLKKDDLNKQIVEQADQKINDETPEKDFYLSKNTQTVKKQTMAQNQGAFQNINTQAMAQKPVQKMNEENTTDKQGEGLKKFLPKYKFDNQTGNTQNTQLAQTRDHLENVDKGMETLLNTKEYVYYTYYNRIKNQLGQYWEPLIKEKIENIFRQGRQIASASNKITKLVVVLDSHGVLKKIQVLGESGLIDLDDAAIEAFKKAAPFPNPPKGIVEQDGTVKIRWDFVLEA